MVNELMYNADGDAVEFIEFTNVGTDSIGVERLNGVKFTRGINFMFSGETQLLAPGDRIVIARDPTAFVATYNAASIRLANGRYGNGTSDDDFALDNEGETLHIEDAGGGVVVEFRYDDDVRWPLLADGAGSSLEIKDINSLQDFSDPANWRASTEFGGSPSAAGIGSGESIVVNEILANTNVPDVDLIELYNPTGASVDISGWWLSNDLNDLDRFILPPNPVIAADGYVVLNQNQFEFSLDGVQGDDAILVHPNGSGDVDLFIDYVAFDNSQSGASLVRWPDETGSMIAMSATTFGAANSGPRIGSVVMTEIMYNPPPAKGIADSQELEYIEVFNPSARMVDLTGWSVDGVNYEFPGGTTIGPAQHLVLLPFHPEDSTNQAAFNSFYHVDIAANL